MSKKKSQPFVLEGVEVVDAAAEGKAIAKHDGKIIFIPYAAPGDILDIRVVKQKASFAEATIEKIVSPSDKRVEPRCQHFGKCGGCKWQHLGYEYQLAFKEKQVFEDLKRIGKTEAEVYLPILGCENQYEYRNKLEFTFSNKAWEEHFDKNDPQRIPALGFHKPGMFDKILDLKECHLAPPIANEIREEVKIYGIDKGLSFYDLRAQVGYLRNLMLRKNTKNEWMLVLIVGENNSEPAIEMFNVLKDKFTEIVEWCYVINEKKNDSWSDLQVHTVFGNGYLKETIEDLKFKIRPQSFFQTNSKQAYNLYSIARNFAALKPTDIVYDLYTGTGSIALFVAKSCRKIVGIEYVETAIKDAKENAEINQIENASFYAGDMKLVLNDVLIAEHGKPDVIITDPPRDGMHPDVVKKILEVEPQKIVYISCNSATQARDIALLIEKYKVEKIQAVDMFPNTHHVEVVALLVLK